MHCHLGFVDDAAAALRPASEDGPAALSCTLAPEEFERDRFRLAPWPRYRVALGLHPWAVADGTAAVTAIEAFEKMAPTVAFVGEVGLDFGGVRGEEVRRMAQQEAFARVLAACDHAAPSGAVEPKLLSVHAVRAADRVLTMLDEQGTLQRHRCIFHWFAGSSVELSRAIEAGCWFSVGPRMLATKRGREYARAIPLDRLLLETDSPSRPGEPWTYAAWTEGLRAAGETMAELRAMDADELFDTIAANSEALLRPARTPACVP